MSKEELEEKAEAVDWYDIYGPTSIGMTKEEKVEAYKEYFMEN